MKTIIIDAVMVLVVLLVIAVAGLVIWKNRTEKNSSVSVVATSTAPAPITSGDLVLGAGQKGQVLDIVIGLNSAKQGIFNATLIGATTTVTRNFSPKDPPYMFTGYKVTVTSAVSGQVTFHVAENV